MFDKLKVPILGLVDNMSFFETDDGKKYNIFGEGGVEKLSKNYNKEFLGKIPISIDLRTAADNGKEFYAVCTAFNLDINRLEKSVQVYAWTVYIY